MVGGRPDTYTQTIELPPHRAERLLDILHSLLKRRRISFHQWQKQIGELQSMILALPGGRGLFSTLYSGYTDGLRTNRLRLTRPLRDALLDLTDLAHDLQARPTRIGEIVDTLPVAYGTADASGTGMGGVWLSADPGFQPFVWRAAFPQMVQSGLITKENPSGSITNSDLELAAQIVAQDLIVLRYDCRERTLSLFTDNISARAWQHKGSVTTLGPAAYLLRQLALHQRHFRYRSTFDYLPGPLNVMADDASHTALAHVDPTAQADFRTDYGSVMQTMRSGVVPSRNRSRDLTWLRWESYCQSLGVAPCCSELDDPLPFLQVFAHRYRTGRIAPSGKVVRARTVEGAVRAVGQTLALLGPSDPRLNQHGQPHFRLQQQLRGYQRIDSPATRVKPIPIPLIHYLHTHATTPLSHAVADIAIIGFFFLLRPGEHTAATPGGDTQPFALQDVTFRVGGLALPAHLMDIHTIPFATFVTLRFTKQKNGTENEIVGHARSGCSNICPVLALVRRALHLRTYHASPETPLCTVYTISQIPTTISASTLTTHLRHAATVLFPIIGFPPADISARALRAGGAMALLCAKVDTDIIKLVGRWHSDQMLRYLHLQAYPQMHSFAKLMVQGGQFTLLNNSTIPPEAAPIIAAAPFL